MVPLFHRADKNKEILAKWNSQVKFPLLLFTFICLTETIILLFTICFLEGGGGLRGQKLCQAQLGNFTRMPGPKGVSGAGTYSSARTCVSA